MNILNNDAHKRTKKSIAGEVMKKTENKSEK